MKIKKMLPLAGMALTAIAFAAPAAAQAEVVLTVGGEPVEAGAPVTATSNNVVKTMGGNRNTCGEVVLHYEMMTNGSEHLVLSPVGAHNATMSGCQTHAFGVTFQETISNAGTEDLTINTWGTGQANLAFTSLTHALGLHCSPSGHLHFQATNTTDVLHTTGALIAPGCNPLEMHGSFKLTSNGEPVEIHFADTP